MLQKPSFLRLHIDNTSNAEQVYYLEDVCVDGLATQAHSSVPVTAGAGEFATASFAISSSAPLAELSTVTFQFIVAPPDGGDALEESQEITVSLQ